jgi:hypothetical protein
VITIKKNKENNIKIIIISIAVSSLFSCISSYATSRYLYDSKEVRYDNTSTSTLTSATDVQTALDDLYSCAATYDVTTANSGFHNSIFRGKDVTEYLTSEYSLYDRISDGTFTDLYVGDYVIVNDITWRIAGFDMYYNKGGGDTTTNQARYNHHAVIVPDTNLTTAQMNTSNTTKGGYVGSAMYKTILPTVLSTYITPVFGDHVLTYTTYLTNSVNTSAVNRTGGKSTGASNEWTAVSRKVDLMNEAQVYGTIVWASSGYDIAEDNVQFPLFRLKPEFINKQRIWFWLRNVVSSSIFACVGYNGFSYHYAASNSEGVRPYFYIG